MYLGFSVVGNNWRRCNEESKFASENLPVNKLNEQINLNVYALTHAQFNTNDDDVDDDNNSNDDGDSGDTLDDKFVVMGMCLEVKHTEVNSQIHCDTSHNWCSDWSIVSTREIKPRNEPCTYLCSRQPPLSPTPHFPPRPTQPRREERSKTS